MLNFNIKYHDAQMPKLERVEGEKSNWIDLRATEVQLVLPSGESYDLKGEFDRVEYDAGTVVFVKFGISVDLTEATNGEKYVANISPRSSTFNRYGLFLTNAVGRIDNTYSGDNDVWCGQFLALKNGSFEKYDRLAQFDIRLAMPEIAFNEVETLSKPSRGGYGTTGTK